MADLLITGFEPFPPYHDNPSWDMAQALRDGLRKVGVAAAAARLPVQFGATEAALAAALEQERPRAALLLGLSGQSPFLDVELFALNVGERGAGSEGLEPPFPLGEGTPDARRNPLDWDATVSELRHEGYPIRLSFHAGLFLCNAAYYAALGWAASAPERRTLFVHMPLLPDQAARHFQSTRTALPSLAPETLLGALHTIARRLIEV